MRIHLAVESVQWIKGDRAAATVEEGDPGAAGAGTAPPGRCQVGYMLREYQLRVPLTFVFARVIDTGQPAQIAVERRDFIFFAYRLQACVEQDVAQLQTAGIEVCHVLTPQVERQRGAIQLVCTANQPARLLDVLQCLFRGQGFTNCLFRQVIQVRLEDVLRRDDHRQAHHGVFGHLIHQGIDRITALAGFPGDVPGVGRRAQPVDNNGPVGQVVEVPQAVFDVRAGLAEKQALREIRTTGQFQLAGFGLRRIGREAVEAFAVF